MLCDDGPCSVAAAWYAWKALDDKARAAKANVGVVIRENRHARGLTLKDVALRAGISVSHLSDIEHGRRSPSESVASSIIVALKLLGVTR